MEVKINIHDTGSWVPRRIDGLYDMTTGDQAWDQDFSKLFGWYGSLVEGRENHLVEYFSGVPDPTLVRLYHAFNAATEESEQIRIAKEFDQYLLSQHFQVFGFKSPQYQVAQPWIKGWNGESFLQDQGDVQVFARLWLDRDLKAAMGF